MTDSDLHFRCRGDIADRDEQLEDLRAENERLQTQYADLVDVCLWCDEVVDQRDNRTSIIEMATGLRRWRHLECALRMVSGSVAHIEQRCGCYMQGSTDSDDPALTRRQAAEAAWHAYKRRYADDC
jgi:hypothetical protein